MEMVSYKPSGEMYMVENDPRISNPSSTPPKSYQVDVNTLEDSFVFSTASIRQGFVRKVFSILLLQIVTTFGVVTLVTFSDSVRDALRNLTFIYVSIPLVILDLCLIIFILVKPERMKTTPINYIGLVVVTMATTFPIGVGTSYVEIKYAVLFPTGLIVTSTLSVLLFCLQSRKELSFLSGFLISTLSLVLTAVLLFFAFRVENEREMGTILGVAVVMTILLEMLWIGLIRGIIFGDKNRYGTRCSEEDYILAAVLLYVVVILIFLVILLIVLLIVGSGKGGSNTCAGCGSCGCHGGCGLWTCPMFGRTRAYNEQRREEGCVPGENGGVS
ncbi:uncharacterized protein LOC110850108 [Folsomia candida]|uniref:Protein lifeguard 1 n=1 Tax=Folsomia candida TaxID=158441 RepID=A0A226EAR3_FOLCA|nr:uncharacterized protein LOC110850108 [Folsomia candida]OXA54645.1 Protein lifeguard 1 [Folsomia candida]